MKDNMNLNYQSANFASRTLPTIDTTYNIGMHSSAIFGTPNRLTRDSLFFASEVPTKLAKTYGNNDIRK